MKLAPLQLQAHLRNALSPVYLITGDEPLLLQESQDAIRQAAYTAGFIERQTTCITTGFDWQEWLNNTHSLSLFSDKRLIELRIAADKIDKKAQEALLKYFAHASPDIILVIITDKLTSTQLNANWAKQVDKQGTVIQIWPIAAAQLPQWVIQRAKSMGLQLNNEVIKLLTDYTEGNLLATHQVLEKLKLHYPNGQVNADQAAEHIADNSRFDIFNLVDAALGGDTRKTLQILLTLKESGEQAVLILWAIARELRQLQTISYKISQGMSTELALTQTGVWEKRKPLFKLALKHNSADQLLVLLSQLAKIDRTIKGAAAGDAWDSLIATILNISQKSTYH